MTNEIKILKERTEIARAINMREMPVVTFDLSKADEYGLVSEPVVIDNGFFKNGDGMPYMINAEIRVYKDEKKFKFSQGAWGIHSGFGYHDMEEMLKYRNAPVIKKDSPVCIVVINSETRTAYAPFILHTTKRIDQFCSTPISFEEDSSELGALYLLLADEYRIEKETKEAN